MVSITGLSSVVPTPVVMTGDKKTAAKADTSLRDAWESTRRGMQEKFLAERLDTMEKITQALTPMLAGALSLPGGAMARPMAGTLEFMARETRDIVHQMGRELDLQSAAATKGGPEISQGFHALIDKAESSMRRTSGMLVLIGSNDDRPAGGRMSAREIASGAAGVLLEAWEELGSLSSRLGGLKVPRLDIRA